MTLFSCDSLISPLCEDSLMKITQKENVVTCWRVAEFFSSAGFEVIQPQNQTVNSDGLASISCEHTANVTSVEDIRLSGSPLTGKPKWSRLCQKGMEYCKNIIMRQETPNKILFIILNIGPEEMKLKYQCEFTVTIDDIDYTETGTPTILLPGMFTPLEDLLLSMKIQTIGEIQHKWWCDSPFSTMQPPRLNQLKNIVMKRVSYLLFQFNARINCFDIFRGKVTLFSHFRATCKLKTTWKCSNVLGEKCNILI